MIVRSFRVLAYESKTVKGQDAIFSPLSLIGAAGNTPLPNLSYCLPNFLQVAYETHATMRFSAYSRHEDV
jgi:hypothetical protein